MFLSLPVVLFSLPYSKICSFFWVCGRKSDLGSNGFFHWTKDFPESKEPMAMGGVGGAMGSTNSTSHIPGSDVGHVTRSWPMKREQNTYHF